jgi:hypothetical protein
MKRISTLLRTLGMVTCIAVASLALPLSAHAGGVHVSIGLGLPLPIAVVAPPLQSWLLRSPCSCSQHRWLCHQRPWL